MIFLISLVSLFFIASTFLHQFKFLKCHIDAFEFMNSLEKCYLNDQNIEIETIVSMRDSTNNF